MGQESPLPGGQRACELGALGGTRTPNLLIRRLRQVVQDRLLPSARWADIPQLSIRDRRCPAAWQQYWQQSRHPCADPRPSAFQAGHIPSWHGSCERYALSPVAAGEDLWAAGPAICLGVRHHAYYPQVTPRNVYEICGETRRASCGECWQSGPDCCTAVIYLHTAVHRLWLTLRRYAHVCGHRRACTDALLPGWPAQASRCTHTDRTAGGSNVPRSRVRACARSTGMPLSCLQYCRRYGNTALLYDQEEGPPCSRGPQVRCAHRPASMLQLSAVMPRVLA